MIANFYSRFLHLFGRHDMVTLWSHVEVGPMLSDGIIHARAKESRLCRWCDYREEDIFHEYRKERKHDLAAD